MLCRFCPTMLFDRFGFCRLHEPKGLGWTSTMLAGWNLQVFDIYLRSRFVKAVNVLEKNLWCLWLWKDVLLILNVCLQIKLLFQTGLDDSELKRFFVSWFIWLIDQVTWFFCKPKYLCGGMYCILPCNIISGKTPRTEQKQICHSWCIALLLLLWFLSSGRAVE